MRVRLKGINSRRKQLADGSWVTYWYAWKGGPRLEGKPGSAEFVASFNAAVSQRLPIQSGKLQFIIDQYRRSAKFSLLAERTKADYSKHLLVVERRFGDFPLVGLKERRARAIFSDWKDELARSSLRQADYAWSVMAACLSWAFRAGHVDANPFLHGDRLYRNDRRDNVWHEPEIAALRQVASQQIWAAFILALWTGQRQGDLLRLPWSAYDGKVIRLKQSKTGARVAIPVALELKNLLDALPKKSPLILTQRGGRPWSSDGFRSSWKKSLAKAGIEGLTFHDLRGTAVTRLSLAGCTTAEIAAITGHSLRDVMALEAYLSREPALAEQAIAKLEKRTRTPD